MMTWHSLQVPHLGLDAARESAKKKVQDVHFEPKNTDLDQPKEGEHDDEEHSGGNRWAGGVRFFQPISHLFSLHPRLAEETQQAWVAVGATNVSTREAISNR